MERLVPDDLLWVYSDDLGQRMDAGVLVILEGASLTDSDGRFLLEDARKAIDQRLHLVPRFRQVIHRPGFGLGRPLWLDAQSFDVADHVRTLHLSESADEDEILQACEELRRRRLDLSKPPWEMWFLIGLASGQVGLFVKLHHAIADGISGVAALGAFVDLSPDSIPNALQSWEPAPPPSSLELLKDNLHRRIAGLKRKFSLVVHPHTALRKARAVWPFVREVFGEAAPRTSLNEPVGADMRIAFIRGRLDIYRDVARLHGAKVNDVLLAAVGGGLRELLNSRGERVDDLVLRVVVPVSLHEESSAHGNDSTGMAVPIPMGEKDHVRRLEFIANETLTRKTKGRQTLGVLFQSEFSQKVMLRMFRRQRFANLYVTNVPGPPVPLYFSGAPAVEMFPVPPTAGTITLGIAAFSYAGQFNVTAIGDRDRCPDLGVFVEGFRRSLDALAKSIPAKTA